ASGLLLSAANRLHVTVPDGTGKLAASPGGGVRPHSVATVRQPEKPRLALARKPALLRVDHRGFRSRSGRPAPHFLRLFRFVLAAGSERNVRVGKQESSFPFRPASQPV